jgi:hypothetical protein
MTALDDFQDWLEHGVEMGWVGPAVCAIHDGLPTTQEEDDEYEDRCVFVVRLYDSPDHKSAVEANHSPSVWRRTNG